jgi:hypothetical protein
MICVVGVSKSINALNAPVRNSKDKNSEFNFLISSIHREGTRTII